LRELLLLRLRELLLPLLLLPLLLLLLASLPCSGCQHGRPLLVLRAKCTRPCARPSTP
jgi:hypothetical protein